MSLSGHCPLSKYPDNDGGYLLIFKPTSLGGPAIAVTKLSMTLLANTIAGQEAFRRAGR